jgi:16S rRNA C1402 N4-methylase RsmH
MESLEVMLSQTPQLVRQGGRLVVISFHSLEDDWSKILSGQECRRQTRNRLLWEPDCPI